MTQAARRVAAFSAVARCSPSAAIGVVLIAGCLAALPLAAKTLRFASGFDPQSLDPHALALQYQTRVVSQIYESLIFRDRKFAMEPALAVSWQQLGPERWRFKLRPGVKFHDGVPFTADDVVFSIERALHKNSQRTFQLRGILEVRKVDDLTVDFMLAAPDAVLPEKLIYIGIMSKAWSMAHGVVEPQNYNAKQETYAVRNTNGTGPYKLKSYESDVRTVLVANAAWWRRRGHVDGSVAELDRRLPYDPKAARALLKEAGYPDGFSVTLDCVNATFRASVCQAIVGMLAQVAIRATFQPWPTATFFPKLTQATSSFFEFGWSPLTDAWPSLNAMVHSYGADGAGTFNGGRYSNPKLDQIIDAMRIEPDLARRQQLVGDALRLMQGDL